MRILLPLWRTRGVQPATAHSTRNLAIRHAAMYEAVNAGPASKEAAADAAAHGVLLALYPATASTLDAAYLQSLSLIPDGPEKEEGVRTGEVAANHVLNMRANDGSGVPAPPLALDTQPGAYQSTPPNFP